jgi:hypothetical protein
MRKKRYEILLPLTHNDGRPVSPEKFSQTRDELVAQFGGVSFYPYTVLGVWEHEGTRYEDESRRITVNVDDTPENHQFFVHFKATLLERFEQLEIYKSLLSH